MRTANKKTVDELIRLLQKYIRDTTRESADAVIECSHQLALEIYGDDCEEKLLLLLFVVICDDMPLKKMSNEEIYKLLEFFDIEVVKED